MRSSSPDTVAVILDEYATVAVTAAFCLGRGEPWPKDTPLQRSMGAEVQRNWTRLHLERIRQRARQH